MQGLPHNLETIALSESPLTGWDHLLLPFQENAKIPIS